MFEILRKTTKEEKYYKAANTHYNILNQILENFHGHAGEKFVQRFLDAFSHTGSPTFLNLDHNVSQMPLQDAANVVGEMKLIVKASAGHVSAYKMNFQSLLTFLISGSPNFIEIIRTLYKETCKQRFQIEVEPVIWLDQKLGDIPSTNYQAADILYKLGFDAVHVLPQIGPDSAAAVQLAAEQNQSRGVIHVVNMTHEGYKYVETNYFKSSDTVRKLRENALGNLRFPVKIDGEVANVLIRATGVIEPANRPYELFEGYTKIYGKKTMIISIGVGPQGALPGCALYAGATCEGIGRFIFRSAKGLDSSENITRKSQLSKECGLLALSARYSGARYPLEDIFRLLKDFNPKIDGRTKSDLEKVHQKIKKSRGLQ
jgi:orotidine-5'-phosphate decarboxylase